MNGNRALWWRLTVALCIALAFAFVVMLLASIDVPPERQPSSAWSVGVLVYAFTLLTTQIWNRALEAYGERLLDTGHALAGAATLFAATALVIAVYAVAALTIVYLLSMYLAPHRGGAMAELAKAASTRRAGASVAGRRPLVRVGG